ADHGAGGRAGLLRGGRVRRILAAVRGVLSAGVARLHGGRTDRHARAEPAILAQRVARERGFSARWAAARYLQRALWVGRAHTAPSLRRSEEHTSELQSRFDLVCRLLLEKKKRKS